MSATEELLQSHARREMEFQNSAAGRLVHAQMQLAARAPRIFEDRREMGAFKSIAERIEREQIRHLSNPFNRIDELTIQAAQDAWTRKKEAGLWFYRRTTGIFNRTCIRKAVYRTLERLFPKEIDHRSFNRLLHAALRERTNYGIVKAHSPPVRLFPKTLHPIDSVA